MARSTESEKNSVTPTIQDNKPTVHKHELTPEALEVERKRVLRKMDLHLLPFVSILYLLSFL